jgi:hypothetical protein
VSCFPVHAIPFLPNPSVSLLLLLLALVLLVLLVLPPPHALSWGHSIQQGVMAWSSTLAGRGPVPSVLKGDLGNGTTLVHPSAVTSLLVQASVAQGREQGLQGDEEDLVFFQGFERNITVRGLCLR